MLYPFIDIFFQVLVNKSHELLREEIINTIYGMASVDFNTFFSQILPNLIAKLEITLPQKQRLQGELKFDPDLPTFSTNISKLVADAAYFKTQNSATAIRLT